MVSSGPWAPLVHLTGRLLRRRVAADTTVNQPFDVESVVDRLRTIDDALPPEDGVACFNRMYLTVTERVLASLEMERFDNPEFMAALDVGFAAIYLDAYDADEADRNPSWQPLFERRRVAGVHPLQFAVAGMNAHINHDLAVATVMTCRREALTLDSPGIRDDYARINDILAEVHGEVRRSFLCEPGAELDARLAPVLDLVGGWSIESAREAAWSSAAVMWRLQRTPHAYGTFRDTLAGTVGLVTRQLLTPLV